MRAYLDNGLYPSSCCAILRYEDFLFRFWDVIVHLSAFLKLNVQRLRDPPSGACSKSHGRQVRGRLQALQYYASLTNRHSEFLPDHMDKMRSLCPKLLSALG